MNQIEISLSDFRGNEGDTLEGHVKATRIKIEPWHIGLAA